MCCIHCCRPLEIYIFCAMEQLSFSQCASTCTAQTYPPAPTKWVDCFALHFRSLQTGMRGAFGKTYGTVARVEIGQILLSVRARDMHKPQVMEALRRAKYKFPGRQRLCVSDNWGFTKLSRARYEELNAAGRLTKDGINVQVIPSKGPLDERHLSKLPLSMLGADDE